MRYLFLVFILLPFWSFAQDMNDVCPLKVGQEVPAGLTLTNKQGGTDSLSAILAKQPTVLVFYRGGWCPYCTRHLSALQETRDLIDSLGYQMIAITPDQFSKMDSANQRAKSDFTLYSDPNVKVIDAFGLGWKIDEATYIKYRDKYKMDVEEWSGEKHHRLPVPAVYIIKDGVVQFQYVNPNYKVRLEASTLVAILKSLPD